MGSVQLLAEDPSKLDGLSDGYPVTGFAGSALGPFLRDLPLWRPRDRRAHLRNPSWNPLRVTHPLDRLRPLKR